MQIIELSFIRRMESPCTSANGAIEKNTEYGKDLTKQESSWKKRLTSRDKSMVFGRPFSPTAADCEAKGVGTKEKRMAFGASGTKTERLFLRESFKREENTANGKLFSLGVAAWKEKGAGAKERRMAVGEDGTKMEI